MSQFRYGLARTVGTQETEHLAVADLERNVIKGDAMAEALGQVLDDQRGLPFWAAGARGSTDRQVWNRQRTDFDLIDPANTGLGHRQVQRYLLASLVACARCGRRLESAWSNGKPAYRCRHGYTSATGSEHGRPKNTYVREDQILPHLAVLAILLAGDAGKPARGSRIRAQLTRAADTAALIAQLHADGTVLTYDPDDRTLRADALDAPPVIIGTDPVGTHARQNRERRTA